MLSCFIMATSLRLSILSGTSSTMKLLVLSPVDSSVPDSLPSIVSMATRLPLLMFSLRSADLSMSMKTRVV